MKRVTLLAAALIAVTGCATSGRGFLATTVFDSGIKRRAQQPSVRIEVSADDNGFVFSSPYIDGITLSGIAEKDETGKTTLYVSKAQLFANWANGWTEATYEASGVLTISSVEHSRSLTVVDPVELWSIVTGEIRYYDSYVQGEEGLSRVRARIDRLSALALWMREVADRPVFGHPTEPGTYGAGMTTALWAYVENAVADTTGRSGSLDRAAFTNSSIEPPPWLPELYASGTIERDVREAAGLLTALYNLEALNTSILDTITLKEF